MIKQDLQKWMNRHRDEYENARSLLSDPEFVRETLVDLRAATIGLYAFNPVEHPPHAAVAWLVEARERMGSVFEDLSMMERYEEYRAMVNEEGDPNA